MRELDQLLPSAHSEGIRRSRSEKEEQQPPPHAVVGRSHEHRGVYLLQNHVGDVRKAFGFVHAGTDELEAQQELPIVPLLLLRVDGLPVL